MRHIDLGSGVPDASDIRRPDPPIGLHDGWAKRVGLMRVFADGIVFQNAYQWGIQRYFREILSRIGTQVDVTLWLGYPAMAPTPDNCRIQGPDLMRAPRRWNVLARTRRYWASRRRGLECSKHNVFHSTYFTLPPAKGCAHVVTVHDMIVERFQHLFEWADAEVARRSKAILSAQRIIAISQATADELVAFYPQVEGRVRVIHHGAEHLLTRSNGEELELPSERSDYVLFVGDRHSYKNFALLLEAAAESKWPTDLHIVVVGKPFSAVEVLLIRRLRLEGRVVNVGRLSDAQLSAWYRRATAFVFPSLCEGFGFPLLEAQCHGAPVLCSDIPVFRELAGDSAEYFVPHDSRSLLESLHGMREGSRRRELRESGLNNVRRFSWNECAGKTLGVYREAIIRDALPAGYGGTDLRPATVL